MPDTTAPLPPPPWKVKVLQAMGVCLIGIFSGLAVYQTPPESWEQFGQWLWQPTMQGVMTALGSLGLNAAARPR